MKPNESPDPLVIAGKHYASRLLIGTGKYKDFAETRAAVEASGADTIYYGTQMRGVSNAKAKRDLHFRPRPLEWLDRRNGSSLRFGTQARAIPLPRDRC